MGKGKKIGLGAAIAVFAFFAFVFVVAAFAPPQSNPGTQNANQESSTPSSVLSVNDEITLAKTRLPQTQGVFVDGLAFKITNATQIGRSITIVVNVENSGQQIEYVSWLDFRLIDNNKNLYEDARLIPPDHGPLPSAGEIAPTANKDFKYVFVVPEGIRKVDCQLVILENPQDLKYLSLS